MNDLLRPSLYGAWMNIIEVDSRTAHEKALYDVVGPVCETGDFLGKERTLAIAEGSLLAVRSAGAYGFTMSSNYNTRPRAAEVLVDGTQSFLIREREQLADLWRGEHLLP
jgi:diaminopimelate decarboxylase